MKNWKFSKTAPWQSALLATCGLSAMFVATSILWQSGYPQWGFLLAFAAVWAVISISWSNIDYTEESGSILAGIVDHNFRQLHERIEELEEELKTLRMDEKNLSEHQSA